MSIVRLHMEIIGRVQGVGFRPFCANLARQCNLSGAVKNTGAGVWIEIQGLSEKVEAFQKSLLDNPPNGALIHRTECTSIPLQNENRFRILESTAAGAGAWPPSDVATCNECVDELFDPGNRRYQHSFISCTRCGPRYSILNRLPFDRVNTTLSVFEICAECEREYQDPSSRRFHAQTIACNQCGPNIWLSDRSGHAIIRGTKAISAALELLSENGIIAVKGIGGFHLLAKATSTAAVNMLRQRKNREAKPLAVMFRNIASVKAHCEISPPEEELLTSSIAPITLVRRRQTSTISDSVAPGNPYLGVFLPYSPLHHLLLSASTFPFVATSGNISGEVLCIDNEAAIPQLSGIADAFFFHDRVIARPLDDSVMRFMGGKAMVLRAARGIAPIALEFARELPPMLALGGQQKSSVAATSGNCIFLSQHLGDLDAPLARAAFESAINDIAGISKAPPRLILHDQHPDYVSSCYAQNLSSKGLIAHSVQHHVAHVFATLAECNLKPPVLGVAWDGMGLGDSGQIWGGECFRITDADIHRVAHLLPFSLPGGDAASTEPCRTAAGILFEMGKWDQAPDSIRRAFQPRVWATLRTMLERSINAPRCTSAGRLFDAVAAILGLAGINSFEAQAAMSLEFAAERAYDAGNSYPLDLNGLELNWRPAVTSVLSDLMMGRPVPEIALAFHNGMIDAIARVAVRENISQVALSGGCFQNRLLLEGVVARLTELGYRVSWNCRVPINDGGLAVGQIAAALYSASALRTE